MIKLNKKLLFLLLISSAMSLTYGQEQTSFNEYISSRFTQYIKNIPREEIYIHADRSEYISGEDLWFSIYQFNRESNNPSTSGKIVYTELLNSENRPVVQTRIYVENGFGPGHIVLPDTLSTGRYMFRAYTNWMKNFLPENCFMKEILIYNAITNKPLKLKKDRVTVSAKNGDHINSPQTGELAFELKVNYHDSDSLEISLTTDENFRSFNNNLCYLFIRTKGTINHISNLELHSRVATIKLPKKILTPGINHITIFDFRREPVMERFIYTPVRTESQITILSSDTFKIRDHASIEVRLEKELNSTSDSTNISVSVIPATCNKNNPDLADYMVFGSEFGVIPDEIIDSGLSHLAPEIMDSFLLTLKSNWIDWNLILSEKLLPLKYCREDEYHFLYGRSVSPDSTISAAGQTILLSSPGKTAGFQYAKTDNDGNFSFNVPINEEVRNLIIQPWIINEKSSISIESSFPEIYLPVYKASDSLVRAVPGHISTLSVSYQIKKIYGLDSAGKPPVIRESEHKPQRFYGKPDIELIMDNFILLSNMEEVFFELTPGLQLKGKNSIYKMTIANPIDNSPYKNPPVLFIDGVVINDPGIIAKLDPGIVEKIDALRNMYLVGDFLFYGLVNVITRAGDFNSVMLPDYALRLRYRVTDPVLSFRSPDYLTSERRQSRIPDFRNTLYWNPAVRPDAEGRAAIDFWTSDAAGEYEVNIQGLTSTGQPVSMKKIITVK